MYCNVCMVHMRGIWAVDMKTMYMYVCMLLMPIIPALSEEHEKTYNSLVCRAVSGNHSASKMHQMEAQIFTLNYTPEVYA